MWTSTSEIEAGYRTDFLAMTHSELGAKYRPELPAERATFWSQNFAKRLGCRKSGNLTSGIPCGTGTQPASSTASAPLDGPTKNSWRGVPPPAHLTEFPDFAREGNVLTFGLTSDQHLGSHQERADILDEAYRTFNDHGVRLVLNCGNWVDGYKQRINGFEVHTSGLDAQLKYAVDRWPKVPGVHTWFVAGDDHEGWWQQDCGVNIGRRFQQEFESAGQHNFRYLGYVEHDLALPGSDGKRFVRVMHPGGGTARSLSLTCQNIVDSLPFDQRPEMLLIGHYHKAEYIPNYGGVAVLQAGCMQGQTVFCRKKNIKPHLGYWIVKITLSDEGRIIRCLPEWFGGFSETGPSRGRFEV